ncbi:SET and MYND domain-containing protein 4 [Microdochium nivale]|nr:SET and MYND domain-containing protein 4 [Microdochium nivale]
MNIKDVSSEGWLSQMWQQSEQSAKQAQQRKGQLVRDHPPAHQLVGRFMMKLQMAAVQSRNPSRGTIATSQLPMPYAPCVRPTSELDPIMIADMKLETHHRGKRVTLRALTPPDRMTAVMAIVDDERGTAVLLQSYYQPGEATVPVSEIMQAGDVFIVKEPFFKTATDGSYTLRVDHLGDLIRLAHGDERVPKAWARRSPTSELASKDIRLQGNTAVQATKWAEAHRLYTSAIDAAPNSEDEQLARLNRSLANMKLDRPVQALSDAELASKSAPPSEKGLFRAARALYELGEFEKCLETLQRLTAGWPENAAANIELERAKARVLEKETGVFPFRQMYKQAKAVIPLIDCATFSAPVEVRSSPGRGNGLFTTVPVSAGQLLVCEKAFGYSYAGEDLPGSMCLMINMATKKGVMGGQVHLLNQLVQKMYHDPRARDAFYELHHGDYDVTAVSTVDGKPVVDSFLVSQILSLNTFGAPRTSRNSSHMHSGEGREDNNKTDSESEGKFSTSGIWLLASRINHSCVGNCRRSFIGDMQIIRAARDLEAGTELLFPYRAPQKMQSYSEVQKGLTNWGFVCACELCLSRKQTTSGMLARHKVLHGKLAEIFNRQQLRPAGITAAQRVLEQMEETYPPPPPSSEGSELGATVRLELWDPYFALGRACLSGGGPVACIQMIVKGLESLGFVMTAIIPSGGGGGGSSSVKKTKKKQSVSSPPPLLEVARWGHMTDMVPWAFLQLYRAYEALGAASEVLAAAKRYAGVAYSIIVGEEDTLGEEFPQLA